MIGAVLATRLAAARRMGSSASPDGRLAPAATRFRRYAAVCSPCQIAAKDREIDRLVYELYGLTDDEIRFVEEATGQP